MLRQATIRLWLDDFHPAVGLLTLFAAICLGLAIAVRVLLLSYNISCFGHSSSVPRHYGRVCLAIAAATAVRRLVGHETVFIH